MPVLKLDWIKIGKKKGYSFDGCTSSPDVDFGECCNQHDYHYQDLSISRKEADNLLFKCMWKRSLAGKALAPVYWTAVRLFGSAHFKRKQDETRETIATDLCGPDSYCDVRMLGNDKRSV